MLRFGGTEGLKVNVSECSVEAAAQTLEDAGITDGDGDGVRELNGKPIEINLYTCTNYERFTQLADDMQSKLGQAGITLNIAALYDRLELKVVTENISEKSHRLAILKDKLGGSFGAVHATISLEELRAMQQEVATIKVPDSIHDLMDDVLCALRAQIPVSDRKFLSYFSIAQAKAWLEGHTEVTSTDLLVLRNYFWQQPSDREFVTGTLERLCVNPMQEKVSDLLAMAQDAKDDFDSACGAAENVRTKQAALRKFRGELVRLYQMQTEMAANAGSDSEKALTDGLLSELERISKAAHEAIGFTYTPLEQLAALQ